MNQLDRPVTPTITAVAMARVSGKPRHKPRLQAPPHLAETRHQPRHLFSRHRLAWAEQPHDDVDAAACFDSSSGLLRTKSAAVCPG